MVVTSWIVLFCTVRENQEREREREREREWLCYKQDDQWLAIMAVQEHLLLVDMYAQQLSAMCHHGNAASFLFGYVDMQSNRN